MGRYTNPRITDVYIAAESTLHKLLKRPDSTALLSDLREETDSASFQQSVFDLTASADKLYQSQGFDVRSTVKNPTIVPSARMIRASPGLLTSWGCDDEGLNYNEDLCRCLQGGFLPGGWGLLNADIEIFQRITRLLSSDAKAFVIGNAFGYSSVILGLLLASPGRGLVDAIDAEVEGECDNIGTVLTRRIAKAAGLNVQVTTGLSPQDVPRAMRSSHYDVAFIDGGHTNEQVVLDFFAVEPHLASQSVVVLHDVSSHNMHEGVAFLPKSWNLHVARGRGFKNLAGTVLLHRGFPQDAFHSF